MPSIDISAVRKRIDALLTEAYNEDGSDVHICSGVPPILRKDGILFEIKARPANALSPFAVLQTEPFTTEELKLFVETYLAPSLREEGFTTGSIDASYSVSIKQTEFFTRVNAFYDSRGISIAFRLLKKYIPAMTKLRIPMSVQKLRYLDHGLVVLTGATGAGKTTTIASLLEAINQERPAHIVTIENPIEYRFDMKKALISQREVGRDCGSFLEGLRDVLRQDPDVILVGEMRDAETIETALAVPASHLQQVLPHLDHVFADCKLFDRDAHIAATGLPNDTILANLRLLLRGTRDAVQPQACASSTDHVTSATPHTFSSKEADHITRTFPTVTIRTPMIPHYTATDENVAAIARFLASENPDIRYELLNYNPLAAAKYPLVGRAYCFDENPQKFPAAEMQHFADVARGAGLRNVTIDV